MVVRNRLWQSGALVTFAALVLAGCPPDGRWVPTAAAWNQHQGDHSGSGQVFAATKPAKDSDLISTQVHDRIEYSSPVLSPDGSVWVASYNATSSPHPSSLLQIATDSPLRLYRRITLEGQLTTPAVDGAGSVYVTQHLGYDKGSRLLSYDAAAQPRWEHVLAATGVTLAPPRVLNMDGGSLIFQPYRSGTRAPSLLMITNDQKSWVLDNIETCVSLEGGFGEPGFRVPGIDLPPPFPEDPAIAIREIDGAEGKQWYAVVAARRCGVVFYRLNLGPNAGIQPTLTHFAFDDSTADAQYYWSPTISLDGTALVADSEKRVTAYNVTTGQEQWQFNATSFVASGPALMTPGNLFAYVAAYERVTKLDLTTGSVAAEKGLVGPTDAAPAIGGSNIFVSTESGIFTYDLDLNLLAFAQLAGGRSSPAIGPDGQVYVATTNGWFHEFGKP